MAAYGSEPVNEPEEQRKLCIGGLNFDTPDNRLREYFSQFGDIIDCYIVKDPRTEKSRGFGFVTYKKSDMVDKVMDERPHELDGRTINPSRITSREGSDRPGAHAMVKKIFIGGIKEDIDESHLREYFQQFGTVDAVEVMEDRETGKKRGFAFVTFSNHYPVDKIVGEKYHTINSHKCQVRKAMPEVGFDKNQPRHTDYRRSPPPYDYERYPPNFDRYPPPPSRDYDRYAPPGENVSDYDRYLRSMDAPRPPYDLPNDYRREGSYPCAGSAPPGAYS